MSAAKEFRRIFSVKNLRSIYDEKIHDSNAIGIDRTPPRALRKRLKEELSIICNKARGGSYRYTPYKEKLLSKGAASLPRVISIPTARDRITLRALSELLSSVFPDAVMEIPQVKIDRLNKSLSSGLYCEFVKIDLRQFYPSIPHDALLKKLRSKIRKPEILSLIAGAISTPTVPEKRGGRDAKPSAVGVPQGLAISNMLAEIFLLEFDRSMLKLSGIAYERYVDDILVLCSAGSAEKLAAEMISHLESIGLNPHKLEDDGSKTKCGEIGEEFDFLGYKSHGNRLVIRRQSIHKFEASLAGIFTAYRHKLLAARSVADKDRALGICEWRLNLRITGCIFQGRRLGWVFYFSQITDTAPLRAVDNTIASLLRRFSLNGKIKVKRLLKTLYESRRTDKGEHRYIPNFDNMSVAEQRKILATLLGGDKVIGLSDERVSQLFQMRIGAAVRELEADLAATS
ncbi:putative reverse transcriptase-Group II intron [Burkholderia cenocepacia]|nr:putative reverse transcriptase-Group II intron [Burkholderia cenocepacia]CAB5082646.1 putative reverse transcriptase-Group II intron [Burkholderia cenocepacia]CAB5087388.1 putative reverse transcriptase-Group II intron [Burkholderia cenocepacia]CAB5087389.1 putative reverse transcriptase-Group II intron [Burkholderia cenocepacia]CAB5087628.1 putative reverse transcriptase-Group II intron [Burkholderia cenocepacia]